MAESEDVDQLLEARRPLNFDHGYDNERSCKRGGSNKVKRPVEKRVISGIGIQNPDRLHAEDVTPLHEGRGRANIQGNTQYTQLNTDRFIGSQIPKGTLSTGDFGFMVVDVLEPTNTDGYPLEPFRGTKPKYTRITLKQDMGSPLVFYTLASPGELEVKPNKYVDGHAKIMTSLGKPWFTMADLELATGANEFRNKQDPAASIFGMFGFVTQSEDEFVTNPEFDRMVALHNFLITPTAPASIEEAPMRDASEQAMIAISKSEWAKPDLLDKSNKCFAMTIPPGDKHWPREEPEVTKALFNVNRPADSHMKQTNMNRLRDALTELRGDVEQGGVSFGFYTSQDRKGTYGFRIFNAGHPDYTDLRAPIHNYLNELCKVEADFLGKGPDYADELYEGEVKRLTKLYRDTKNLDQNGVVGIEQLIQADTPSRRIDNEGAVMITPALLAVAQNALAKMAEEEGEVKGTGPKHSTEIAAISENMDSIWRTVKDKMNRAKQVSENVNRDVTDKEGAAFREMTKDWKALLQAYDPNMASIDPGNMQNVSLRGWTRMTKGKNATTDYVFIPPTVVSDNDRDAIKAKYILLGYHPDAGIAINVIHQIDYMMDNAPHTKTTAKVATHVNNIEGLDVVFEKAKYYISPTADKGELERMQKQFNFSEFRAHVLNRLPVERAEDAVLDYLNSAANEGKSAKAYKQITDDMTSAFKDIYIGTMNNNQAVADTLMSAGPMYLPEENMSVLFGPSGALYKIIETGGKGTKPTIEEIPARIFAKSSLYMRVVQRLSNYANGKGNDRRLIFSAGNAFLFDHGTKTSNEFVAWSDKVISNLERIRANRWAPQLRGVALYSRLQGMLNAGFRKGAELSIRPDELNPDMALTDKYKIISHGGRSVANEVAGQAYQDVVKYVQNIYGDIALHEEEFRSKYQINEQVSAALSEHYQREREKLTENLNEYANAWHRAELSFDSTVAKIPDAKKLAKTIFEMERDQMEPSVFGKLSTLITNVIAQAYAKFVEGIHSVFDLMNPIKILNSLQAASFDAINEVSKTMFSILFSNFINRHFADAPIGKKTAHMVFEKMGVHIMTTEEHRLLGKLSGSKQLSYNNDTARYKHNMINATFPRVIANTTGLLPQQLDARDKALRGPDICITEGRGQADPLNGEFDIVYNCRDTAAFDTPELGGISFDDLADSKEKLNSWWHHKGGGFDLLFPAYLGSSVNSTSKYEENKMSDRVKEWAMKNPNPSSFVKFDGRDIRITLNMQTHFNMNPRDIYGSRTELSQGRRAMRTQREIDQKVAAHDYRDPHAGVPRAKKQSDGSLSKGLGKGTSAFSGIVGADDRGGNVLYDPGDANAVGAETSTQEDQWSNETPDERILRKEKF